MPEHRKTLSDILESIETETAIDDDDAANKLTFDEWIKLIFEVGPDASCRLTVVPCLSEDLVLAKIPS